MLAMLPLIATCSPRPSCASSEKGKRSSQSVTEKTYGRTGFRTVATTKSPNYTAPKLKNKPTLRVFVGQREQSFSVFRLIKLHQLDHGRTYRALHPNPKGIDSSSQRGPMQVT